jgi:hypothetical protein
MKKLVLILSFCCSLAMAENVASTPIKSTQNSNSDQPKLIMVKGVTSNQTNYTAPQKHATQKQSSHAKKTSSHKQTKARKSTKNTKHTKTTANKTAKKSKATKNKSHN